MCLYVAATPAGEGLYLLLSLKESSPSGGEGEESFLCKGLEEAEAAHVDLEAEPPGPEKAVQGQDLLHLLTEGLRGFPLSAPAEKGK